MSNAVHPREFWGQAALPFPDLKRLVVRRPAGDGQSWKNLEVDAAELLDSGDRGRDVRLQPGDIVEIPEADHPVDQKWSGFTSTQLSNLLNCVSRTVTIVIKGTENRVPLELDYQPDNTVTGYGERGYGMTKGSFMLMPVLWKSGLVRASSDLSRVKVTRKQATGKRREWVIDCSGANGTFPDLWLQDGDVIEVPDKL